MILSYTVQIIEQFCFTLMLHTIMSKSYSFEYLLYCHFFRCTSCHFLCCCVLWFLFTFFLYHSSFFHLPSSRRRSHVPDCNVSILFLIEISCKCVSNFNRDNLLVLFFNVSCKYMYPSFCGGILYISFSYSHILVLNLKKIAPTFHVSHRKLHHSSLSKQFCSCFNAQDCYPFSSVTPCNLNVNIYQEYFKIIFFVYVILFSFEYLLLSK